ncbi:AMIN-like domain-containing (lipo)protein [Amycolatopsis azurea]|uniref:AMIN-like domain-containing protein n=1 Tax=Amycolatopsis azurea DSM 43854 TaxID=1238180 RepID=M2PMN6_9PSEU|nr:hypothetical protein [Amycolatopsis azurea]EMD25783.1 hypothetical protein C791_4020 [Amycolatopsis azurea DSM 43854]OOC05927.1 hypothetical protein B0293_16475 [Amycolatopsis azurea DSM 43854]
MTLTLRRALGALAATALMLTGAIAAVAPTSLAAQMIPAMTGIRTGQNPGFDRVVLDLTAGPAPAVRYDLVDELIADGSGDIVWLTGEYFIAVAATPAAAHDDAGNPTYPGPQKFRTRNLRNVMAVAVTGDYEGTLSIGLGVRSRTPVSVFTLTSPNRVVIDVRH